MKKKRTKNYSAIFKHHETIKIFKIFSRGQSLFILIDIKKTKKNTFYTVLLPKPSSMS